MTHPRRRSKTARRTAVIVCLVLMLAPCLAGAEWNFGGETIFVMSGGLLVLPTLAFGVSNGYFALERDTSPKLAVITLVLSGVSLANGAALVAWDPERHTVGTIGVVLLAASAFAITTSLLQLMLGKRSTVPILAGGVDGAGRGYAALGFVGRF